MHRLPSAPVQGHFALLGSPDMAHGPRPSRRTSSKETQVHIEVHLFHGCEEDESCGQSPGSICLNRDAWFEFDLGFDPKSEAGSDSLPKNMEPEHGESHGTIYTVLGREQK